MTDKEFHRLKRRDLLAMLLAEKQENERLRAQIAELSEKLGSVGEDCDRIGSIAEASLRLSGIFEDAQRAADLYLDKIREKYPLDEDE